MIAVSTKIVLKLRFRTSLFPLLSVIENVETSIRTSQLSITFRNFLFPLLVTSLISFHFASS